MKKTYFDGVLYCADWGRATDYDCTAESFFGDDYFIIFAPNTTSKFVLS